MKNMAIFAASAVLALFVIVSFPPVRASGEWYDTSSYVKVYMGGGFTQANWSNDSNGDDTTYGGGSAGVTMLFPFFTASLYQDGGVKQIKFRVNTGGCSTWRVKLYSTDFAGTYTYVAQSNTFSDTGTGIQTVNVTITGGSVGNIAGIFIPHGCALALRNNASFSMPYVSGDVTTIVSVDGTAASRFPNMFLLGDPPMAVHVGDSISAGHDEYKPPFEGYQAGYNVVSQTAYAVRQVIATGYRYQAYGVGSTTCANINTQWSTSLAPVLVGRQALVVHCGVNYSNVTPWSTIESDLNTLLANVVALPAPASVHIFLEEITPCSSCTSDIADRNAHFATWASTNASRVTLVSVHDPMGTGPGFATPNPAYFGGSIHPNATGYGVMGTIEAPVIQNYYVGELFPLPSPVAH